MSEKRMRALTVLLMAALLMGMAPSALAAGFKAVVKSKEMKVYSQDSGHELIGIVPMDETVTVKAYSGDAALISYNGHTGVARVSDMAAVTSGSASETASQQAVSGDSATVVTTKAAKVYRKASAKSDYVTVKKGTKLKLLSVNGKYAKVKRGGTVGYIRTGSLSANGTDQQVAAENTVSTGSEGVQKYDRKAVVTTRQCRVYARPSTSSDYVSVEKGAKLTLLATKGSCAMVERNGKVGYMDKADLTEDAESSAVRTADNAADSKVDLSGNNEQIVFKFLTKTMGYNTAAACGVMANIKYESGYKPTSGGDRGSSYGIVQWHLGRKTRLQDWCSTNGFDYTTLEGQLYYLAYELKNRYPAVHKRLLAVSNDEQGAYDAGYDFCYNFEAPANRAGQSVTRGNYARETLWNRYKT